MKNADGQYLLNSRAKLVVVTLVKVFLVDGFAICLSSPNRFCNIIVAYAYMTTVETII